LWPIHKIVDKSNIYNCRPVSPLLSLSKVLETLRFSRLNQHLQLNKFLAPELFRFIKGTIIEYAIFTLMDIIFTSLNHWQQIVGIKSYLTNRKQKVNISPWNPGAERSWGLEAIISGVPQGSILGPLFSIYINDLPCGIYHSAKLVIYADDTSVLITVKNVHELQVKAKTTQDYTSKWCLVNSLTLSIDKTDLVIFSSNHYHDETFLINYQNNSLKESTNTIYLGLELDKRINWKNHINKILPKLNNAYLILSSTYSYSNTSTLRMIYFVYIYATMECGIIFWGNLIESKKSSYSRKGSIELWLFWAIEHDVNLISETGIINLVFTIHTIPDEVLVTEFGNLYI